MKQVCCRRPLNIGCGARDGKRSHCIWQGRCYLPCQMEGMEPEAIRITGVLFCHLPVNLPAAPHGRTRPDRVTGSPISPASMEPENDGRSEPAEEPVAGISASCII